MMYIGAIFGLGIGICLYMLVGFIFLCTEFGLFPLARALSNAKAYICAMALWPILLVLSVALLAFSMFGGNDVKKS